MRPVVRELNQYQVQCLLRSFTYSPSGDDGYPLRSSLGSFATCEQVLAIFVFGHDLRRYRNNDVELSVS